MASVPDAIELRTGEIVPLSALEFSTSRSGGPGGQNVNKVETRVEVRFNITEAYWLHERTRARLFEKLGKRLDSSGAIRVISSTERTQLGNRNAAVRRLGVVLNAALVPEKPRVPTKASRASK